MSSMCQELMRVSCVRSCCEFHVSGFDVRVSVPGVDVRVSVSGVGVSFMCQDLK